MLADLLVAIIMKAITNPLVEGKPKVELFEVVGVNKKPHSLSNDMMMMMVILIMVLIIGEQKVSFPPFLQAPPPERR